jgi:hypothetical protein
MKAMKTGVIKTINLGKLVMHLSVPLHVLLLTAFTCVIQTPIMAQDYSFALDNSTRLMAANGDTLRNAWTGGINAGQYSTIHLNNDGIEDLVVFDRTTNKLTAFTADPYQNTYRYQHAPEYEQQFPKDLQFWMLMVDYNNDGKKDIFTHTSLGIRVYKNSSTADKMQWKLEADPLETQGFSGRINLYVASSDIPAIVDVDGDGDLDIFTFDDVGGSVEFHMNRSKNRQETMKLWILRR